MVDLLAVIVAPVVDLLAIVAPIHHLAFFMACGFTRCSGFVGGFICGFIRRFSFMGGFRFCDELRGDQGGGRGRRNSGWL